MHVERKRVKTHSGLLNKSVAVFAPAVRLLKAFATRIRR